MENTKKWYNQSVWIIVLLVLFFPVGLFLMWRYARWNKKVKIGLTSLFAIILLIGASDSSKKTEVASQTPTTPPTVTQSPSPTSIAYEFDIPSLVGKNLDGVIAILGKPDKNLEPTAKQIQLGVKDWDQQFTVNGKDLLVNYNISTRKINSFFVQTDDPSGKTQDTQRLLALGNLKENDPRYKVEFVRVFNNSDSYTGVKVIPTP